MKKFTLIVNNSFLIQSNSPHYINRSDEAHLLEKSVVFKENVRTGDKNKKSGKKITGKEKRAYESSKQNPLVVV